MEHVPVFADAAVLRWADIEARIEVNRRAAFPQFRAQADAPTQENVDAGRAGNERAGQGIHLNTVRALLFSPLNGFG